jgi:signal transduction histidine kinase
VVWGPQHTQIYNDGYWPICGAKHPQSMGQDFSECWASAWPAIGDAFNCALGGETSFLEDQRMFLDRNGFLEETFFTFSFSPIRDESGSVGGLFHPVTETSNKMLAERRTRVLRDLAGRMGNANKVHLALTAALEVFADYPLDVPFALLYALEAEEPAARLACSTGLPPAHSFPQAIDLDSETSIWPVAAVARSAALREIDLTEERLLSPCGPYPDPPKRALAIPLCAPGQKRPAAVLIAGISSRLPFNDMYRGFFEQVAAILTTGVANALAYEEAGLRAEKLAALDRAKTLFFSNVSHELRTPLTLIMGSLEDALAGTKGILSQSDYQNIVVAHRNCLRLLKLVNTLLDFSRIEAGRLQANFRPVDLAQLTNHLSGVFRSTIEKAGMELLVECEQLPRPVYLDQGMWEKIVLNLLSNAFKFTFAGRITVSLRPAGDRAELTVADTGCGIPEAELNDVFKRFHRIEGTRGRTYEGSGIGLALVEELVSFHGGKIRVASTVGLGSAFTVSIPFGKDHLPADSIGTAGSAASTGVRADSYVEEALRWLPDSDEAMAPVENDTPAAGARPYLLLADDNADMREYIRRLLGSRYEIAAVADGEAAWRSLCERRPDLLLTDVMMPGLDGMGLLARLRADAGTCSIPVIILSARAGEESRVEGLEAGADDYLVKPFSARELVARVRTNLEMVRLRGESARAEEHLKAKEEANSHLEAQVIARTGELEEHRAELEAQNEELLETYHHLEQETAERVRVAEELRDKERLLLQQSRMAAMGDMLFNIAHQWRQPLNVLGLTVQHLGLLGEMGELNQEVLSQSVEKAMDIVQHLSQTINDFTNFSKPDKARTLFRVEEATAKTLSLARDSFGERGIAISVQVIGDPVMYGHLNEFCQALLNILMNAFDVLIERGGKDPAVTVRSWTEKGRSIVTIADNAGGIGEESMHRIFDPFFTTKEQGKGTGIGLFLAKTIIEKNMGGSLTACNVAGGAEFRIEVSNGSVQP